MITIFSMFLACGNTEDTASEEKITETSDENTSDENSPSDENEDPQKPVVLEADFFCK